jgi:hypothetical protein
LAGLTAKDFAEEGFFFQIGVPPIRIDILMGVPGMPFKMAWDRRVEINFDGLPVLFIGKEDLIHIKRASGRPQDMIDADLLSQDF